MAPGDLRETIQSVVSERPDRTATLNFVTICHRLAASCLLYRKQAGRLDPGLFGKSIDDVALDAIADLFQREIDGRFPRLISYYRFTKWQQLNEDELFAVTRRLVFGAVDESLFRSYRDEDPSLSRIIRNLKRAIDANPELKSQRRLGARWICFASNDQKEGFPRPVMPPEFLENVLTGLIDMDTSLQQILGIVTQVFRNQTLYRRSYPLTALARVIRSIVVRLNHDDIQIVEEPLSTYRPDELIAALSRSIASTRSMMWDTYVGKAKVSPDLFEVYMKAITDRLSAEFVRNDGKDTTNFQVLQSHLKDLTHAEYNQTHRAVFEYLSKRTRENFIEQLGETR